MSIETPKFSVVRVQVHFELRCPPIAYALLLGLPTPTMPFNMGGRGVFQRSHEQLGCVGVRITVLV